MMKSMFTYIAGAVAVMGSICNLLCAGIDEESLCFKVADGIRVLDIEGHFDQALYMSIYGTKPDTSTPVYFIVNLVRVAAAGLFTHGHHNKDEDSTKKMIPYTVKCCISAACALICFASRLFSNL